MIFTLKMQHAIRFAIKTHEQYQKQKRKGKDVPFIVHPLTVGIILASIGASEDLVIAGILHDTIEDSILEKKVTPDMIEKRFGSKVSSLVLSVTETHDISWNEYMKRLLDHIDEMSRDSMLLKSADILGNIIETVDDHCKVGDIVFERFYRGKGFIKDNYELYKKLKKRWPQNPLLPEILKNIKKIN